jgi:dTDP-4-dehydrorhamnose reductase
MIAAALCNRASSPPLELWGGIECTRNRVADSYFDQLEWNGHRDAREDLERMAQLGIRTIRYPVLWECAAPDDGDSIDWRWADSRLPELKRLGMRPIVGLVHHGSGPLYTSLLDPGFPTKLASFARSLAERFPWVDAYTPVNEPLTTARFSALYGHWYPHARDDRSFATAMLIECRAVALAMQAIRGVQPDAKLVQTEDLGQTFSTSRLRYQAEFESERRWLTYDLLCGRVDRHHAMGSFLLWLGVPEAELEWFREHPCPPDVLGINYYVTSDRYLDHRLDQYPPELHGGNGHEPYVDTEAVRARPEGIAGARRVLNEAWARYRLPVAISEAHLGCSREEQLRWVWEIWKDALAAREDGASVMAVTIWSMLGTYDWDSLVTQARGHYEVGAFDVRGRVRRPTAVAGLAKDLAHHRKPSLPVLEQQGWWHCPQRLHRDCGDRERVAGRPIVIAGATGTLGQAFGRICRERRIAYQLLNRRELDIADPVSVQGVFERLNPWACINAAGYVRVDEAERDRAQCIRENVRGPRVLATVCASAGMPLVTFSSDLVFNGRRRSPYAETAPVDPLGIYGLSKAAAERHVLKCHTGALVVRTSAFFGPWDEYNFLTVLVRELMAGREVVVPNDLTVSPTYVPDLVHATLDLLIDGAAGLWHLANEGEITWEGLALRILEHFDLEPRGLVGRPAESLGWTARRPKYSVLTSVQGRLMPALSDSLTRYVAARQPAFHPAPVPHV